MNKLSRTAAVVGALLATEACIHRDERRGDDAVARGDVDDGIEAYSEALSSHELLRDEALRIAEKRRDTQRKAVVTLPEVLEAASDEELAQRLVFILTPFIDSASRVSTAELEAALARSIPRILRAAPALVERGGDLQALRNLAYQRGLSATVLHTLDGVLVASVLAMKDGPGKPNHLFNLERILHERGGLDSDIARLDAEVAATAERVFPEVEKTALTRPSEAVSNAVAIIAVLPADHPLRARAQALRDRLAQVHLDLAAKLPDNPGARLLHLGFAYVLSGRKPGEQEQAWRDVTGRVGVQWVVSARSTVAACAPIAETLGKAFGYAGASNAPTRGTVSITVDDCSGTVSEEREEKQVQVGGGQFVSAGGTRAGGCVDANGSPAGCQSSGTVYQTTVTTGATYTAAEYKTIVKTFRKRDFTLGAKAVAAVDGASNTLDLTGTKTLSTEYQEFASEGAIAAAEEENGRKTFPAAFTRLGSDSLPQAMADQALDEARARVRDVTAPLMAVQAAKTLARFKATGGAGTDGEDAYMEARFFNGKMTVEDTASIATRYGMTHFDVKEGVFSYVPPDLGPPTLGPRGGLLAATANEISSSDSEVYDSSLLDPRAGTYGRLDIALMQMSLTDVLVDPDRDALHLRISGLLPLISVNDFTGLFRMEDGVVLTVGLGKQGDAGAKIDDSEYTREAAAGYRLLLGVGSEKFSLLAGAEIHARYLTLGVALGDFVAPLAVKLKYRLGGQGFLQVSAWGFNPLGETDTVGAEVLMPFGRSAWGLFARAEQWKTPLSATLFYAPSGDPENGATTTAGRQVTTMIGGGLGYAY